MSDWPQMGHIRDSRLDEPKYTELLFISPGCVPFGANLTHVKPKYDTPVITPHILVSLYISETPPPTQCVQKSTASTAIETLV